MCKRKKKKKKKIKKNQKKDFKIKNYYIQKNLIIIYLKYIKQLILKKTIKIKKIIII